jgi:ABC-type branched-subunit amino acid transport system substrate-binding protein
VAQEAFGPKDTDMTAQLTNAKNAGPQAIVVWTIGPAGSIVSKNKAQLGIDLPLFQCHGLPDPKYIELAGKASEGDRMPATKLMVVDALSDTDPQKPVIKEFVRLYTDEYGYHKQFPINTHSGYAWDAIMIVASAMKQAGTEADSLRAAIERTNGLCGYFRCVQFDPGRPQRTGCGFHGDRPGQGWQVRHGRVDVSVKRVDPTGAAFMAAPVSLNHPSEKSEQERQPGDNDEQ